MVCLVVDSLRTAGSSENYFDGFNNAGGRLAMGTSLASGDTRAFVYDGGAGVITTSVTNTMAGGSKCLTQKFETSETSLRINGTNFASNTPLGTVGTFTGIDIGRYNGAVAYFQGYFAEILIYQGEHDATQMSLVESYLRTKWGTA